MRAPVNPRPGTPWNRPDVDPLEAIGELAPDGLVRRAEERERRARMPHRSIARAALQRAVDAIGFAEVRRLMTGDHGDSARGRTQLYELLNGTRSRPSWDFAVALELSELQIRCVDWRRNPDLRDDTQERTRL